MIEVELPRALYVHCAEVNYSQAEVVQNALYHQFNIEVGYEQSAFKLPIKVLIIWLTCTVDIICATCNNIYILTCEA